MVETSYTNMKYLNIIDRKLASYKTNKKVRLIEV